MKDPRKNQRKKMNPNNSHVYSYNVKLCSKTYLNSELFKRQKHTRELKIKKLLETNINQVFYSHDKIIDSSCNMKRPDFVYDCKTHFVVVEVDEDQHSNHLESCETSRMMQIAQSIGMPTIFIRYNPDKYKADDEIPEKTRRKILIEWVNHCMVLEPKNGDEFLRVVYLFYDGFDPTNVSIKNIKMV
jgi:hypothetical protein